MTTYRVVVHKHLSLRQEIRVWAADEKIAQALALADARRLPAFEQVSVEHTVEEVEAVEAVPCSLCCDGGGDPVFGFRCPDCGRKWCEGQTK